MICSQSSLADVKRPEIEWLRIDCLSFEPVEFCQVTESGYDFRMLPAEGFLADRKGFAVHSLGFVVALLYLIERSQIVETLGYAWVRRTQRLFSNDQSPLKNAFSLGVACLLVEDVPQVVQTDGDIGMALTLMRFPNR